MSDATDFQRMVATLTQMGMDPQAAAAAVATGRVPQTDYMEPALPAGLTEDGQRAVAELQNLDRTRNAGNRNRSTIYPLPDPGEYEPFDPRALPMPDDYSPRALPPADPKFTPNPDYELPSWISVPADAFTSAIPPSPSLDTYGGILGFGGVDAPDVNTTEPRTFADIGDRGTVPNDFRKPEAPSSAGTGRGATGNPARAPNPEVQAGLPSTEEVSPNPLNPLQQWTQDKFGWDETKRGDIGRAMLMGGLATMAGDSPYALQNIGKGGMVGVDEYFGVKDDRYERERQEGIDQMARERHQRSMANDSEGQVFEDLQRAQNLIQMGLDPADFGIDISRLGIDDALVEKWGEEPLDDYEAIKLDALKFKMDYPEITDQEALDRALAMRGRRAAAEAGIGGL